MLVSLWENKANSIYDKYVEYLTMLNYKLGDFSDELNGVVLMDYGIGHVVWADGNFESRHIKWCLGESLNSKLTTGYIRLIKRSLKELLLLGNYEDCEDYEEKVNE